jgi:hypothetical protein
MPQESLSDAATAEPVEDVHPEESILEILLLSKPDPGSCHHAAVQPHEEEPQLLVVVVAPRFQPGVAAALPGPGCPKVSSTTASQRSLNSRNSVASGASSDAGRNSGSIR